MATQAEYDVGTGALAAYAKANVPSPYEWVLTEQADLVARHEAAAAKAVVDAVDAYRARMAAVAAEAAKGLD